MIFLQFASKKEHARTFGQTAPSGKFQKFECCHGNFIKRPSE